MDKDMGIVPLYMDTHQIQIKQVRTQSLCQHAVNYPHLDKQKVTMVTQQDIFFIRLALFYFVLYFLLDLI